MIQLGFQMLVGWYGTCQTSVVPDLSGFNVDCIIHLAAVLEGEWEEQERTTIGGTTRLLAAAKQAGIGKVVGISSMAVLDYPSLPPMSDIDETAPVATDYVGMGQYAAIKARQEELLRAICAGRCAAMHRSSPWPGL